MSRLSDGMSLVSSLKCHSLRSLQSLVVTSSCDCPRSGCRRKRKILIAAVVAVDGAVVSSCYDWRDNVVGELTSVCLEKFLNHWAAWGRSASDHHGQEHGEREKFLIS